MPGIIDVSHHAQFKFLHLMSNTGVFLNWLYIYAPLPKLFDDEYFHHPPASSYKQSFPASSEVIIFLISFPVVDHLIFFLESNKNGMM